MLCPAPLAEGGLHSLAASHCHKVPGENKWKYFLQRQGSDRERRSQTALSQGALAWPQSLLHPSSVPAQVAAEKKWSSESDLILPCSSFTVQFPLFENKQALSYKNQIYFFFLRKEKREEKRIKDSLPIIIWRHFTGVALHETLQQSNGFGLSWTDTT